MSKPLVYLDQNIIGLQIEGTINLTKGSNVCWVYSNEHFAEISRSSEPEKYLNVLDNINAKLLRLEQGSNWRITESASLVENVTPIQHYHEYLDARSDVEFDDSFFDIFQVWVNGGGDEGPLKDLPNNLAEQVLSLTKDLPFAGKFREQMSALMPELNSMIDQMIEQGNDIRNARNSLGDEKGAIGNIDGKNPIIKIWDIIGPSCPGVSCDQFFGFDPTDKQGYDKWPTYLGIVGCCAVMDVIGFQAEKKCRKLEKIPNIRSDSGHIGMGAFCEAIVSADARLYKRAKAIYTYKDIAATPLLIQRKQ